MSALVGVIMGSKTDWSTLSHTVEMLDKLGIPNEVKVVSAHRTPDLLFQYAEQAEARGIQVIIAGAGGAAHLPGMCAAKTHLPVLGVPVQSAVLSGVDSRRDAMTPSNVSKKPATGGVSRISPSSPCQKQLSRPVWQAGPAASILPGPGSRSRVAVSR